MTTAIYHICDICGDEIKESRFYADPDSDDHFHEYCLHAQIAVAFLVVTGE